MLATAAQVREMLVFELKLSTFEGFNGAEGISATANFATGLKSEVEIWFVALI